MPASRKVLEIFVTVQRQGCLWRLRRVARVLFIQGEHDSTVRRDIAWTRGHGRDTLRPVELSKHRRHVKLTVKHICGRACNDQNLFCTFSITLPSNRTTGLAFDLIENRQFVPRHDLKSSFFSDRQMRNNQPLETKDN